MNFFKDLKKGIAHRQKTNISLKKGISVQRETTNKKRNKYLVIGEAGVGKSSLFNSLFGCNLPVGIGGCTQSIEQIKTSQQIQAQIYDSPGWLVNNIEDINVNVDQFDFFLILFESSLKSIQPAVQYLIAICPQKMILIRTKCDLFHSSHKRSLSEQLKVEMQTLKRWGLWTSLRRTSAKSFNSFDNHLIKMHLAEDDFAQANEMLQ